MFLFEFICLLWLQFGCYTCCTEQKKIDKNILGLKENAVGRHFWTPCNVTCERRKHALVNTWVGLWKRREFGICELCFLRLFTLSASQSAMCEYYYQLWWEILVSISGFLFSFIARCSLICFFHSWMAVYCTQWTETPSLCWPFFEPQGGGEVVVMHCRNRRHMRAQIFTIGHIRNIVNLL